MTSIPYLSVQALTKYIKRKFDADPHLRDVYVKGELSNVKIHTSGHIYFTLKDDKTRIPAVMFAGQSRLLKFRPENGMNVLIRGDVNVFEGSGQYQLYAQYMQPDGIGELFVAFEQLKGKLSKEGLFSPQYKKPIPSYPQKIGVITAPTGAAIRDICSTLSRRYPIAQVVIIPALVQGKQAAPSIVQAIEQANNNHGFDVLIVGRGGGSIEDLWAFNEEIVARAIFHSKLPIISAVGHETDTTIADYVADLRAATPTAAAELAVPNQTDLLAHLLSNKTRIFQITTSKLNQEKTKLAKLQQSYPLAYPERLYRPFTERLTRTDEKLQFATKQFYQQKRFTLQQLVNKVHVNSPLHAIRYQQKLVEQKNSQLEKSVNQAIDQKRRTFLSTVRTLEALNPLTIMTRGYSIVYKEGKVMNSVHAVEEQDVVTINFHDGQANASITNVLPKKRSR